MWLNAGRSYWVQLTHAAATQHRFFGPSQLGGADCPNCNLPLTHLLTLDTSDERLGFLKEFGPRLPLLFCWRCSLAQDVFGYEVCGDEVRILRVNSTWFPPGFPYSGYPEAFPETGAELVLVTATEHAAIKEYNRGELPPDELKHVDTRHQVGGEFTLQDALGVDQMICRCGREMPIFARIGNECTDPRGICGNDYAQLVYFVCLECSVPAVIQMCD